MSSGEWAKLKSMGAVRRALPVNLLMHILGHQMTASGVVISAVSGVFFFMGTK